MPHKKPNTPLGKFLVWRAKHISKPRFVLILSVLLGFFSGLVAVFIKNTTHYIQGLLTSEFFKDYYNPYYFVFPFIGILITLLLKKYLIRHKVRDGISSTLYTISRRSGIILPHRMYGSVITSIFTVGFGGSVGLEGPAVSTGAALGSNLGKAMHLNYKTRILLISCASAGAIAAMFNAPIAAIIFTIEIFSLDLVFSSLIPLLLASVSGAVTSLLLLGNDYLFEFKHIAQLEISDVPFYILLGVLCALASVYFTRIHFWLNEKLSKIKGAFGSLAFGSLALGVLIFIIPPLYGEGYDTINHLLNGSATDIVSGSFLYEYLESHWIVLALVSGLVLLKVFAASFTISAGGVGGYFAPTLFMGAGLGFVFSALFSYSPYFDLPTNNFTLVGMAGMMAGILHSPLTAIFMIAEITGGYQLFVPLMLVSAISFLVTKRFNEHSIYTEKLAKRGDLLTHNKDQVILTLLKLDKVLECNFTTIKGEMNMGELVKVVSTCTRNIFPVVNEKNELKGILTLDDFRHLMFDQTLYENTFVYELMSPPPATIERSDTMETVMKKFQDCGAWNLPVVDNGHYLGFVSKSKLFSVYRRKLIEFS